jgi:hypothetical protein
MGMLASESNEELRSGLEKSTGQAFVSRDDMRAYVQQRMAEDSIRLARSSRLWQAAKSATLLALLVLAYVQYHLIEVMREIVGLMGVTVFVPVSRPDIRSAWELLSAFI